jgi:hypothetical protein
MERAAGIIEITKSLPHSRVDGQTVGKTYRVLFHGGRQVDASGTLNAESFVFGNLYRIRLSCRFDRACRFDQSRISDRIKAPARDFTAIAGI